MNAMTDFPTIEEAMKKDAPIVPEDTAEIRDGKALVKLTRTEAGLQALRVDLAGKRYDLKTVKGNDEARADRQRCVKLRTSLEAKRKAMKAPALEFGKLIDAEAKRITDAIVALEEPIDAAIKADEKRREEERAERERIEAERIAGLRGQVDAIMGQWVERCNEPDMTSERIGKGIEALGAVQMPADLADVADYWSAQQSITTGRMVTLREELARREESARLAAERAELDRQRAEQEAERNRIAGINRRVEEIRAAATGHDNASSATLGEAITAVQALAITEAVYAEFTLVAMDAKINTLAALVKQQKEAQEREAKELDEVRQREKAQFLAENPPQELKQTFAEEQAQAGVAENPLQQQAGLLLLSPADAAAEDGAGDEAVAPADDSPAAPAFDLTPDATDLLGDAATQTTQTTEQAARALLDHIAEAFTGRFPSDPKPGRAWFITLKTLASNLNDTL